MAYYRHLLGDDRTALDLFLDMRQQAKVVANLPSYLITHLVSIAIDGLAAGWLEDITPQLRIGEADGQFESVPDPASRAQVRRLVDELLDDSDATDSFYRAMLSERMLQLDCVRLVVADGTNMGVVTGGARVSGGWGPLGALVRPLFKSDGVFLLQTCTSFIRAAQRPDYPSAVAVMPQDIGKDDPLDRLLHPLTRMLLPSFERAFVLHYRALAMRRMAAVALAIRLFEVDHGQRPEHLDELVPSYIDRIPLDPFAADGQAIRYRPHAARAILYSVSTDGVDQDGAFQLRRSGSGIDWDKLDLVFLLNGDRAAAEAELKSPP